MNCLNRIKIQEYIDNEINVTMRDLISTHLDSCEKCNKLYLESLDDIRFINESLLVFKTEPEYHLSFEEYAVSQRKHFLKTPIFLRTIAAILLIFISTSIALLYFQQPKINSENEMMVYSLMDDFDPNKQWHDSQMLLTITNEKNEIVFSFIMDNND